jgi:hypothetical protein
MFLLKITFFFYLSSSTLTEECGRKSTVTPVLFGGRKSMQNQWPWLGRLFYADTKRFFCSSTLISEKHLLSGESHISRKKIKINKDYEYEKRMTTKNFLTKFLNDIFK